jgi:hypothetical protein
MEWYLNVGISARAPPRLPAANTDFGKNVSEFTLAECASS